MKIRQRLILTFFQQKIKWLAAFSRIKAAEEAFKVICSPFSTVPINRPLIYDQAKHVKFLLHGSKVRGYRWKHPRDKKVLILHGFSSAPYKYEKYIISLINKGYEVLAFDAPAHGRSEGKTVNALEYRDMILKVQKRFGPIDKFIAHSFGGLALCLALEELDHTADYKVALIAPTTETSTIIEKATKMLDIRDKVVIEEINNLVFKVSQQHTHWFSVKRALKKIKADILWIHDEDDDVTPLSDAAPIRDKTPSNVTFHITKGLGHNKIYQDEEVREKIVKFL